ncbi:hypothetical protein BJ965_001828 [Streptomyces luteogriseus]|uniref:Uncharacterized protein n=1 Tax=Streptomyces luteogriseus TaxID=68233 RepID=A0A7W7GFM5_9ACTN|nr:hypothetical protein [Streptomyces luteogriseus]
MISSVLCRRARSDHTSPRRARSSTASSSTGGTGWWPHPPPVVKCAVGSLVQPEDVLPGRSPSAAINSPRITASFSRSGDPSACREGGAIGRVCHHAAGREVALVAPWTSVAPGAS